MGSNYISNPNEIQILASRSSANEFPLWRKIEEGNVRLPH